MDERLERFRIEAEKLGPAKAGRRFSKELIALGAENAESRRSEGASWQCIADELGVGRRGGQNVRVHGRDVLADSRANQGLQAGGRQLITLNYLA